MGLTNTPENATRWSTKPRSGPGMAPKQKKQKAFLLSAEPLATPSKQLPYFRPLLVSMSSQLSSCQCGVLWKITHEAASSSSSAVFVLEPSPPLLPNLSLSLSLSFIL